MTPVEQTRPLEGFRASMGNGTRPADERVAVVVVHGMGQQVPFETLEGVADAIRAGLPASEGTPEIRTMFVELGSSAVPRAELTLAGPPRRDVHLYEAYWAPLTEAKVTIKDVLDFVFSAIANVLRHGRSTSFDRVMFNWLVPFPTGAASLGLILLAGLVLLALVATVTMAGLVATAGVLTWARAPWVTPQLIVNFTLDLLLFAVFAGGGAGLALVLPGRFRSGSRAHGVPPRAVRTLAWASMIVALVAVLVTPVLMARHLVGHRDTVDALWNAIGLGWLGNALAFGEHRYVARVLVIAIWLLAAAIWTKARTIIIQFPGDVAVYASSHRVSRFAEVRDAIQAKTLDIFRGVYAMTQNGRAAYDRVIIVGHSLGSVVAYDCLNKLTIQDGAEGLGLRVSERTALFLTFGSPLDKIAYVFRVQRPKECLLRETMSEARQPFILDYKFRPRRWVNLYSRSDLIGAKLDYFDLPTPTPAQAPNGQAQRVCNLEDPDAFTPLAAHTEHWRGRLLAHVLGQAVADVDSDCVALNRFVEGLRSGTGSAIPSERPGGQPSAHPNR